MLIRVIFYHKDHKSRSASNLIHKKAIREKANIRYAALPADKKKERRTNANKRAKERKKTDKQFHMACVLRKRLVSALHNFKKNKYVSGVRDLGCTMEFFIKYIESKFVEGMTWENYGKVWELDHIIPLALFSLDTIESQKKAVHYTNLQPLFSKVNHFKGAKVDISSIDFDALPFCERTPYVPKDKEKAIAQVRRAGLKAASLGISQKNGAVTSRVIIAIFSETGELFEFASAKEASRQLGIPRSTISNMALKKKGYPPTCSYGWQFHFA